MKLLLAATLALISTSCAAAIDHSSNNMTAQCKPLLPETADLASTDYSHLVKAIRIPSGTSYRYVFSRPSSPERPWLLLIHGFPSTSFDWRHQVKHFVDQGCGVVAPDLLGYGGTDNPPALERFALKRMVEELRELLDCEGVDKMFAVGHDFGSLVLSRVTTYMPERLLGVAFVGVGYASPPLSFNQAGVEAANNATLDTLGYPAFGYWYFMNDDRVASIMDIFVDSAYTLTYTNDSSYIQRYLCPVGEYEKWLLSGNIAPWREHLGNEDKATFKRIFALNGGFDGPVKSYKSLMRDINGADEASIPQAASIIQSPVLLITASQDKFGIPEVQISNTQPYAANLRVRSVSAGHFLQLQAPDRVNEELQMFVEEVLDQSK